MKERPIIFDAESIRAILAGGKTQTRRVIRPKPDHFHLFSDHIMRPQIGQTEIKCPYGWVGDRLWVREAHIWGHAPNDAPGQGIVQYGPDDVRFHPDLPRNLYPWARIWRKRPAIHMPRWASRITLEITGVRVERVQDITDADARAEGYDDRHEYEQCRDWFEERWDAINKRRGFGWDTNLWVWVVEFRMVTS